jgi:hypothetical protein
MADDDDDWETDPDFEVSAPCQLMRCVSLDPSNWPVVGDQHRCSVAREEDGGRKDCE